MPIRTKENVDFPVHLNANIIEDADGVCRGTLYILADISEQFMEIEDQSLYKTKELGRNCTITNMDPISAVTA